MFTVKGYFKNDTFSDEIQQEEEQDNFIHKLNCYTQYGSSMEDIHDNLFNTKNYSYFQYSLDYDFAISNFFNPIFNDIQKENKISLFDLNIGYIVKHNSGTQSNKIISTYEVKNSNTNTLESTVGLSEIIYMSELLRNTDLIYRIISEKYNLD